MIIRRSVFVVSAVCALVAGIIVPAEAARAAAAPPYLTLLFGRAQWDAVDACSGGALPGSVALDQVAAELQTRGLKATAAVVTNPTLDSQRYCQDGIAEHASWDDLATLRDTYGWTMVSTGQGHADITTLTPQQQSDESCGSLAALQAHGHLRAWGMFAYPNNSYTTQIQTDVVQSCFAYGRRYITPDSPSVNSRATTVSPWFQWTLSINGGACNDVNAACYDEAALGVNRRYLSPAYIGSVMQVLPDQWAAIQAYRFVTGANAGNGPGTATWDCTDADWHEHWTSAAEMYCWDDYKTALDTIPNTVTVTDPASVADSWGHDPAPPPPDKTTPKGLIVSPTQDHVYLPGTVGFTGTATDNRAIAAVDLYVKDRSTNKIWHKDGTWSTVFQWQPTTLSAPGQSATNWSFDWPALATGNYAIGIRVKDTSLNLDPKPPLIRFSVVAGGGGGSVPQHERTLGGPLHYDIYPSGIDVAPDGSLLVADTGNDQVKKFQPDGTLVWSVGDYGNGVNQFYEPRDVGVDSDGNVYVIDTRNSRIVKLDPNGQWLFSFNGPAGDIINFPLGLSVHNNKIYLADLGKKKVRVFDTNGTQLAAFVASGVCTPFTGIRDADADSAGNIYVAGYSSNTIMKLSPTGTCITAWGSTGTTDGKFRTPYGVRVAFDPVLGTEAVYVADALNNRVQEFTLTGTFVTKFGTPGSFGQDGTFNNLRRATVATDGSGDVWGADLWGSRLVRFHRTPTGYEYAQTIGVAPPPTTDAAVFHESRESAFSNDGTMNVIDTVHHRIVRMNPTTGAVVGTCGQRGSGPGQFNWPRGIAVDPATDQLWVADTKANRLQVLRPNCTVVQAIGTAGTGLTNFNWPSSIAIRTSDRIAWMVDTQNHRIKSYNVATRQPIATFGAVGSGQNQFKSPLGIAVDPTTGHVYVADTGNNRLIELADTNGSNIHVVRYIAGFVSGPEGLAIDAGGRIFVADSNEDQIVVLTPSGALDLAFDGPDGMFHPSDVTVGPDAQIYISDTYNDRIEVFSE